MHQVYCLDSQFTSEMPKFIAGTLQVRQHPGDWVYCSCSDMWDVAAHVHASFGSRQVACIDVHLMFGSNRSLRLLCCPHGRLPAGAERDGAV